MIVQGADLRLQRTETDDRRFELRVIPEFGTILRKIGVFVSWSTSAVQGADLRPQRSKSRRDVGFENGHSA